MEITSTFKHGHNFRPQLYLYKFSACLIIFIITAGSFKSFAQEKSKYERIKALKVSFITEKLELTPNEAEKFWPIYNSYDDKIHDLRKQEKHLFREKYGENGNKNDLSETESEKLIKRYNEVRDKRHLLEKEMMYDLIKQLPASKIVFLPEVEDDFSRMLFEEYKKRHDDKKP